MTLGLARLREYSLEGIGIEPTTRVCHGKCGDTEAPLLQWAFSQHWGIVRQQRPVRPWRHFLFRSRRMSWHCRRDL